MSDTGGSYFPEDQEQCITRFGRSNDAPGTIPRTNPESTYLPQEGQLSTIPSSLRSNPQFATSDNTEEPHERPNDVNCIQFGLEQSPDQLSFVPSVNVQHLKSPMCGDIELSPGPYVTSRSMGMELDVSMAAFQRTLQERGAAQIQSSSVERQWDIGSIASDIPEEALDQANYVGQYHAQPAPVQLPQLSVFDIADHRQPAPDSPTDYHTLLPYNAFHSHSNNSEDGLGDDSVPILGEDEVVQNSTLGQQRGYSLPMPCPLPIPAPSYASGFPIPVEGEAGPSNLDEIRLMALQMLLFNDGLLWGDSPGSQALMQLHSYSGMYDQQRTYPGNDTFDIAPLMNPWNPASQNFLPQAPLPFFPAGPETLVHRQGVEEPLDALRTLTRYDRDLSPRIVLDVGATGVRIYAPPGTTWTLTSARADPGEYIEPWTHPAIAAPVGIAQDMEDDDDEGEDEEEYENESEEDLAWSPPSPPAAPLPSPPLTPAAPASLAMPTVSQPTFAAAQGSDE